MNQNQIKNWLRRIPQPASILADGKKVAVPDSAYKWQELAETIEGLGASQVQALDASGQVIRALSLTSTPEPDPAVEEARQEERRIERETRERRDHVAESTAIARIMQEVQRTSIDQVRQIQQDSFNTMTAIVHTMMDRLSALEKAYFNAFVGQANAEREAILADAEREAEEIRMKAASENSGDGSVMGLIGTMASGLLGPGPAPSPPSPPSPPPSPSPKQGKK